MAEAVLECKVVAEPLRLLVGVDVAPDPGDQGTEVQPGALGLVQAETVTQPQCDQALAHRVLHGLPHAEIRPSDSTANSSASRTPDEGPGRDAVAMGRV